jgi:transposase-like protein
MKLKQLQMTAALTDYKQGIETTKAIARRYGISASTLRIWAKANGVPLRKRGRRPLKMPTARHQNILEGLSHQTYAAIGREEGISKQAVWRLAKRWNRSRPPKKAADKNIPTVPQRKPACRGEVISFRLTSTEVNRLGSCAGLFGFEEVSLGRQARAILLGLLFRTNRSPQNRDGHNLESQDPGASERPLCEQPPLPASVQPSPQKGAPNSEPPPGS